MSGGRRKRRSPELVGKARRQPGRQRLWHVKGNPPSARYPSGRVRFIDPDTQLWRSLNPNVRGGQSLEDLFDWVETWLDDVGRNAPSRVPVIRTAAPTMTDLATRYLEWLAGCRTQTYVEKVENIINVWILPRVGKLPVSRWSPTHSSNIVRAARDANLSAGRIEGIGNALSGMRQAAHRKPAWLPKSDNPLEDVSYTRKAVITGAARDYIEPQFRPHTKAVHSAVEAARALFGDVMALQYELAGFEGPRLGEQLGLRAIDIDFISDEIDINGAWIRPRKKPHYRGPVKNRERRKIPLVGSIRPALRAHVVQVLGLADEVSDEVIAAAQHVERLRIRRREKQTKSTALRSNVPDDEQLFLFVNPNTASPWTGERFNELWHRVVAVTRTSDGFEPWPADVAYRNMRHHAATWFKAHTPEDQDWELVARWLGNKPQTCRDHYVLPSQDAMRAASARLRGLNTAV